MSGSISTNRRNALIALDLFLGKSPSELADQYALSIENVETAHLAFAAKRSGMLRCYFTNQESRDAVVAEYGVETLAETDAPRLLAIEARLDEMERALAVLSVTASTIPAIAQSEPPNPNGLNIPQLAVKNATAGFNEDRQKYRTHVTGQATAQWRDLFGSGSHGGPMEAPDDQIRKRILGVYYQGTLEGHGTVWTVKGVNRYSVEGVLLKCVLQRETMYISNVERIAITDM